MNNYVSMSLDSIITKLSKKERVRDNQIVVGSPTTRKFRYFRECLNRFTTTVMKRDFRILTFSDVDKIFLQRYVDYLNGQNVEDKLRMFRRAFNEANTDTSVFTQIEFNRTKVEKEIDHSVIMKVQQIDRTTLNKKEGFYLDLFLLCYYTGGSTLTELAMLRQYDLQNRTLYCERVGSGKIAEMELCDEALNIIERYTQKCYGDYLLPIYSHKHNSQEQRIGRINRLTALVNQTLSKAAKTLHVKGEVTTSTTRRIFIELALVNNIPFEGIAKYVGCSIETVIRYHEKLAKMSRISQDYL